jgi:quinoprotein glucose dehydrogenase
MSLVARKHIVVMVTRAIRDAVRFRVGVRLGCDARRVPTTLVALVAFVYFSISNCNAVPPVQDAALAAKVDKDTAAPLVQPASNKAQQMRSALKVPNGMKVDLWAAEPLLADPVAICFDTQGRLYVTEHHRNRHGTEDTREHPVWLDDDRAATSVADRLAYMKKYANQGAPSNEFYLELPDRVVRVVDKDGDGRADHSDLLALFQDALDGPAAGVVAAADGSVWINCIPHVWRLPASMIDKSDPVFEKMFSGFGVKFSFHGHDLHGLVQGPDGRLYWSIGDRGYNIVTQEGNPLVDLWRGAVFRCETNGSNLEVFATGLRNPQELVFDDYGNLFTVDNDNDAEDNPRLLNIIEGADYGWHSGALWVDDRISSISPRFRHPWYEDGLWKERHEEQPAWVIPAIAHLANGPCGLDRNPGLTRLPDEYAGSFFLCDWRGGRSNSPLITFKLEAKENQFTKIKEEEFLTGTLATDVTFGPDGRLYLADGVDWTRQPEGGRRAGMGWIWAIDSEVQSEKEEKLLQLQDWLRIGCRDLSEHELVERLSHADVRIRSMAQFELVQRGETGLEAMQDVAKDHSARLTARVHALQGIGQCLRHGQKVPVKLFTALLSDDESEVRAQTAKLLVDSPIAEMLDALVRMLDDRSHRCRAFAALALGSIGSDSAVSHLFESARENADADVVLRHMIVMGLTKIARKQGEQCLVQYREDPSTSVRMVLLLAFRNLQSESLRHFLTDKEPILVREAVRAVHDRRVDRAMNDLAALSTEVGKLDVGTARRVLNARFCIGRDEDAFAIAQVAIDNTATEVIRIEALSLLADWPHPSPVDRVLGDWRPQPERSIVPVVSAAQDILPKLIAETGHPKLVAAAAGLAGVYRIESVVDALFGLAESEQIEIESRMAATEALVTVKSPRALRLAMNLLETPNASLRSAGRKLLYSNDSSAALIILDQLFVEQSSVIEMQLAIRMLGEQSDQDSYAFLTKQTNVLLAGKLPRAIALDLLDALDMHGKNTKLANSVRNQRARAAETLSQKWLAAISEADSLREFRVCLEGGDAARGKQLFHQKVEIQCVRCHRMDGMGTSIVGPDLTGIGRTRDREYLLRSIVTPGTDIAKNFELAVLLLDDGNVITGVVREEDEKTLSIEVTTGSETKQVTVDKDSIEERKATSAMPLLANLLSKRDLRDLIEYLAIPASSLSHEDKDR